MCKLSLVKNFLIFVFVRRECVNLIYLFILLLLFVWFVFLFFSCRLKRMCLCEKSQWSSVRFLFSFSRYYFVLRTAPVFLCSARLWIVHGIAVVVVVVAAALTVRQSKVCAFVFCRDVRLKYSNSPPFSVCVCVSVVRALLCGGCRIRWTAVESCCARLLCLGVFPNDEELET